MDIIIDSFLPRVNVFTTNEQCSNNTYSKLKFLNNSKNKKLAQIANFSLIHS